MDIPLVVSRLHRLRHVGLYRRPRRSCLWVHVRSMDGESRHICAALGHTKVFAMKKRVFYIATHSLKLAQPHETPSRVARLDVRFA